MNTEQALDIIEIQQLLATYVYAIDAKDFDRLDEVFTADAIIDYTATGGVCGDYSAIKRWLARALAPFSLTQHMIGLPLIRLSGNRASVRTMLFNPMRRAGEGGEQLFFIGASYVDDLVRTAQGWRIQRRCEADAWVKDAPPPLASR
jgi:3-phenylpropionate/cinnamic acid dioxygenase small subunit